LIDIVDKLKIINEYDFSKEASFFDEIAKNIKDFFDKTNSNIYIKILTYTDRF
jgi:hypothetical protein